MPVTDPEQRRVGRGPAGEALLAEAAILSRCRHPGVVELRRVETEGDVVTLVTAGPAGHRVTELVLAPEEVAGVAAVVATTLADLHDVGVAHGGFSSVSVIVGQDGRPVIEGFSLARSLDGPSGRWARHELAAADDRALGALLSELLRAADPTLSSAWTRPRRSRFRFRPGRRPEGAAVIIAGWADAAARGEVHSRRLAEAMADEVPGARLPGAVQRLPDGRSSPEPTVPSRPDAEPDSPDNPQNMAPTTVDAPSGWAPASTVPASYEAGTELDETPLGPLRLEPTPAEMLRPGQHRRRSALLVALVLVAAGIGWRPAWVVRTAPSRPSAALAPAFVPPGRPVCLAARPGAPAPTSADCAIPTFAAGVVTIGPHRFRVGRDGDVATTGDWTCSPPPTLALLEPATGRVWRFTSWPTGDGRAHAIQVGVVPGARHLRPVSDGTCDALEVGAGEGVDITFGPWGPTGGQVRP